VGGVVAMPSVTSGGGHPVGGVGGGEVWQASPVVELVAETAAKLVAADMAAGAAGDEEGGNTRVEEGAGTVECLLGWGQRLAADLIAGAAGDENGRRRGSEEGEEEFVGHLQVGDV